MSMAHGRLRRIAVQQNVVRRQHLGDPRDVLNRPNFVVHRHCGKDQNALVQASFQSVHIDESFVVHRNRLNRESFARGKRPGGGQDAFVLNGTYEDTPAPGRRAPRQTEQGEVIGFGGAGCENDPIGVGSRSGRRWMRLLRELPCLLASR